VIEQKEFSITRRNTDEKCDGEPIPENAKLVKHLKFGPYNVVGTGIPTFKSLKDGINVLASWPRGKTKQLRDVLRKPVADRQYFMTILKNNMVNTKSNIFLKSYGDHFWNIIRIKQLDNELEQYIGLTPLHDMIEILDFYPKELI